jgi:hypothetical protein
MLMGAPAATPVLRRWPELLSCAPMLQAGTTTASMARVSAALPANASNSSALDARGTGAVRIGGKASLCITAELTLAADERT